MIEYKCSWYFPLWVTVGNRYVASFNKNRKKAVSRIQVKKLEIKQVFYSNILALYLANKIVSFLKIILWTSYSKIKSPSYVYFFPVLFYELFLLPNLSQLKIVQMSGQVSRSSAGEYQADERAGVARLSWRVTGRWAGRWWTGRPGVLWFMGSRRVRHDWATEHLDLFHL